MKTHGFALLALFLAVPAAIAQNRIAYTERGLGTWSAPEFVRLSEAIEVDGKQVDVIRLIGPFRQRYPGSFAEFGVVAQDGAWQPLARRNYHFGPIAGTVLINFEDMRGLLSSRSYRLYADRLVTPLPEEREIRIAEELYRIPPAVLLSEQRISSDYQFEFVRLERAVEADGLAFNAIRLGRHGARPGLWAELGNVDESGIWRGSGILRDWSYNWRGQVVIEGTEFAISGRQRRLFLRDGSAVSFVTMRPRPERDATIRLRGAGCPGYLGP